MIGELKDPQRTEGGFGPWWAYPVLGFAGNPRDDVRLGRPTGAVNASAGRPSTSSGGHRACVRARSNS